MYISSRSKLLSFVKSFLIKLFNKEYNFSLKNSKANITGYIDNFYPKSKIKFITAYLTNFPQFKRHIRMILIDSKLNAS
jgi:hypothetical protein